MFEYIKDNFGNRPSINEAERMELDFLRMEVQRLRQDIGAGEQNNAADD